MKINLTHLCLYNFEVDSLIGPLKNTQMYMYNVSKKKSLNPS